ncbi:hypothetical protein KSP39_PZI014891 [Platanthera zijinensis]|uniref:Uncharacterized protein n=1 Tax=Platanthera zijinensis TaxID=2320716 RepID=A0AAP0G2G9_9ASPA
MEALPPRQNPPHRLRIPRLGRQLYRRHPSLHARIWISRARGGGHQLRFQAPRPPGDSGGNSRCRRRGGALEESQLGQRNACGKNPRREGCH